MTAGDVYPNDHPKCPVCGHADYEAFEAGDGGVGSRSVDHVACAQQLKAEVERLRHKCELLASKRLEDYLGHRTEVDRLHKELAWWTNRHQPGVKAARPDAEGGT
jgi:hypothetical protein